MLAAAEIAVVPFLGDGMTAVRRWALAALSTALGLVLTWAVYRTADLASPPREPIPTPVLRAPEAERASTLWLLAVGVSRYASSDLNLRFADVDARSVAAAFESAAQGGMYVGAETRVLTNGEVSRESMLSNMERFLGQAGPEDVAVLFVAGHGVRDLESGSYYFLPHPASADNLLGEGLRMSDFDETLRVLRRNVRAVVVMLDTCHAGALGMPSGRIVSADEMAAQVSVGEGFFLLAATKPGEESKEQENLGHGAFTYALLEAMGGAADTDGNGTLSVSELFGYVARRVPDLTAGQQHPYHKMEGTDVALLPVEASVASRAPTPLTVEASTPGATLEAVSSNTIGVMQFQNLRAEADYDWISKALRIAFNTELSKVQALRVYSPELIDRTARARGFDQLYTARQLGIGRLLTGSFHVTDHTLRVDAHIVDAKTGVNEASDSVEGDLGTFFDLQKLLVLSMLRRLRVHVSAEEGESIQGRTNTDVDAYRLLLESEGEMESGAAPLTPAAASPAPSTSPEPMSRGPAGLVAAAYAQELPGADDEAAARALLESYRRALEEKGVERVAALYVAFSEKQRQALGAYFASAGELRIEIGDVAVTPHGADLAVSFTRRDRFVDRESGRPVNLEVRLTKILVRAGGTWKIGAGK